MTTELDRIAEELWRLRRDLEDTIERGRDAQNPWQVLEGHWDEIQRRMHQKDRSPDTERLATELREKYLRLKERNSR
jgi:hypothetical protein